MGRPPALAERTIVSVVLFLPKLKLLLANGDGEDPLVRRIPKLKLLLAKDVVPRLLRSVGSSAGVAVDEPFPSLEEDPSM